MKGHTSSDPPVDIVPYDAAWPARFEAERRLLLDAIGGWIVDASIEHIGSTAIPGLAAKPVIDIMAGVESLGASRPAVAVLERHGYCYAPYRTEVMHWLCKPSPALRTHHLHLVPLGSPLWIEQLAFRDHLRTASRGARVSSSPTAIVGTPQINTDKHGWVREIPSDGFDPGCPQNCNRMLLSRHLGHRSAWTNRRPRGTGDVSC